ncbi:nitrous oxide reductase accessory protein NosL [Thermodesulfobacteriota bacterium]
MYVQNWVNFFKSLAFRPIFIFTVLFVFMVLGSSVSNLFAMEKDHPAMTAAKQVPDIEHPIKKPKMYSKTMRCPNCGMMINMWARTRHSFHHQEGDLTTCSIRCLADKTVSSGADPTDIQVAMYIDPDKMMPVEKATYVIGSAAPGTMTMKSKIAFADKASAEQFASSHGGEVVDFQGAFAAAKMELPKSRMMIDKKRKKTGKIKEPTEKDGCTVCGMYPARYPKHKCQIWAKDGKTLHFCSTKCMVNFNADPAKYVKEPAGTKMAWVTLYSDGMYESAFGAYYVVGSQINGPMGREAIPFKLKKNAEEFLKANGGQIVSFSQLTPSLIMNGQ